jgi:hypothetical protein
MTQAGAQFSAAEYLDFEVEIGEGIGREYPVAVIRSPAGEARDMMTFPFDQLALEAHLKDIKIALLQSGGKRRVILTQEEQAIHDFGRALFDALFSRELRSRLDVSLREAAMQGKGLRLKLRFRTPELAALPWEYLYDPRQGEFMCLSRLTPVVRYLELPQPVLPLEVSPPLRILGMIASPNDLPSLDVQREQRRVAQALRRLRERGLVEMEWLSGQTWRDLQQAMWRGPWHIFHFIGHGSFDAASDEGIIALADDYNRTSPLRATQLGRLLADHPSLRLVMLNACEGARGGDRDIFSSTASILVRRGIPAVLAMQHEITDQAAVEFARTFYEALASGMPVDAAVVAGRIAVSVGILNSVEWGTPVLYMRTPDGVLFRVSAAAAPPTPAPRPAAPPSRPAPQRAPAATPVVTAAPEPAAPRPEIEHPAAVGQALVVRFSNRLGVTSTLDLKEIATHDKVLEHKLRSMAGKIHPSGLPLRVADGVLFIVPWRIFRRAYRGAAGDVIVLLDGRELTGAFAHDMIAWDGTRMPIKDVTELELVGAPESDLRQAAASTKPITVWQLDIQKPKPMQYTICNPRFGFQYQVGHPMGAFTYGAESDSFHIKLGEGDEVLAYFSQFDEVHFDRQASPPVVRVVTEKGSETEGGLIVSTEASSYYMSRTRTRKQGSNPRFVASWFEERAIDILFDAFVLSIQRMELG